MQAEALATISLNQNLQSAPERFDIIIEKKSRQRNISIEYWLIAVLTASAVGIIIQGLYQAAKQQNQQLPNRP